jgi:8-oxo-dGTP pyrophosphatase MutT (NUDIX family)
MAWTDPLLRVALTSAHRLVSIAWLVRRPRTFGAHALAFTPERRIVLVKLRYASGWRLPGGGHGEDEDPRDAVLRELREEIGMTGHGRIRLATQLEERPSFKRDLASLMIVEDVLYTPRRWSLEVEQVMEAALDALPEDIAPSAAVWIEAISPRL